MRPARALACAVVALLWGSGTEALADPVVSSPGPPVVLVATVAAGTSVTGVAGRAGDGEADVRHVLAPLRRVSVEVAADDVTDEARRIDALPGVTSVTRAARRFVTALPDDASYSRQQSYLDAIDAPAAWAITHGSPTVKIGVIDTGIDATHPDLDGKIAGTFNVAGGTSVADRVGHGTFVAGVAAAETNNGTGVAGSGYDSSLLVAKVDRSDPNAPDGYVINADDEAAGIEWAADSGAKIINISLGAAGTDPTEQDAIEYAQRKGALIVAAAGNESTSTPSYPAAYAGVVAVGATDAAGRRADFSNFGSWVDLAAPGTNIFSTTVRAGSTYWPASAYNAGDGTSFSSPLVAGAAALLVARYPTATAAQLGAALTSSAHGYRGLGLGAGQVDFAAALTPASLSGVTGTGATVFPQRDGYLDSVTPTVVLGKAATLSMTIRNAAGAIVRSLSSSRGAGRVGLPWSGTDTAGRVVRAGRYTFQFSAVDALGNRTVAPAGNIVVSSKRLVTASVTLTRRGARLSRVVRDARCERMVRSKLGRRLINSCVPGRKRTVQAAYRFTLPAAFAYTALSAGVRGRSLSQPGRVTGRAVRAAGGTTVTRLLTVRSRRVRTYSLGRFAAARFVSGRRVAQLLVGVTNRYTRRGNPSDFDISAVSLRITYRVLR